MLEDTNSLEAVHMMGSVCECEFVYVWKFDVKGI